MILHCYITEKKNKKSRRFHETWKIHEIQIVSKNKFLLKHNYTHLFTYFP